MDINHPFIEFVANSDCWAWETDSDLRMVYLSPNFEALTGQPQDRLLGVSRLRLAQAGGTCEQWAAHAEDLRQRRAFRSFRHLVVTPDGSRRWIESSGSPNYDSNGDFLGYLGIARDITEDCRATEQLELADRDIKINETVFHHVERIAKIGAWKYDVRNREMDWSRQVYQIYELEPGSPIDNSVTLQPYPKSARKKLQKALARTTATGEIFDIILPFVTAKSNFRWVRVLGDAEIRDGRTVKLFGTCQDVTDEQNHQNEIQRLAETDHLTGLANRARFRVFAKKALDAAAKQGTVGALCFVDLDQFKQTNDHFGHAAGDAVLRETSEWLKTLADENAQVARLGGDEFVMVMTGYRSEAEIDDAVYDRFSKLQRQITYQGRKLDIGASVGYVVFPGDAADLDELMANADLALYDAKSRGRRKISKYRESFGSNFARKMDLIGAFKTALSNNEIVPYYQPIIDLRTNRLSGFEALARWIHPVKGVIAAGAFAEVFDNQELVADIGDVIIKAITTDMGRWKEMGVPFGRIGMNVTDANLLEPGFILSVSAMLARNHLLPQQLVFEITENTVFKSKRPMVEALTNLQSLGVQIALDDFGTGFSSLTHLQDIPFNILKIDKAFAQRVDDSLASRAIVQSLAALGNSLGYSTVAEGVETASDAESLRGLGCERGQGYYFAKPMPASQVPTYMKSMQPVSWSQFKAAS